MRVYSPMNLRAMLSADNIAQELQKVQTYLRQLDGALNQIPGITGNPVAPPGPPGIVPNPFDNFFYLPGRAGGQIGYGDTNASGILVLSSTRHATKGNIYFGSARSSLYDELNNRFGANTTSPQASVHAVGVSGGVAYSASQISNSSWGLYSGSGGGGPTPADVHVALTSPQDGDGGYIGRNGDNNGIAANCSVALNTTVGSGTTFTVRFWGRLLGAAIPVGTSLTFNVRNSLGNSYYGSFDPSTLTTTWTEYTVVCSTIGSTGNPADSLRIDAVFQTATGASGYLLITYAEVLLGTGTSTPSIIAQAASGQAAHLFDAQDVAADSLVNITAGGRFTIETDGSMRFVPGAGANKVPVSNASGDLTLTALTLFGSIFDTTGTPAAGDIIYRNGSSQWARLPIGSASDILTVTAGFPAWVAPTPSTHALLSATHTDTVASTPVRGGIIVANSTPAWAQLAVGAANTVLRSNGTDPSYGTIDHNYIDDRTRSIWFSPSMMTTATGTMSLGMVGTYPNNYHAWQFATSAAAGQNKGVHMGFTVPLDWKTGTDMTIYVYTAKVAGAADVNGYDVITSYISRADNESLTTAVAANTFITVPSTTLHLLDIASAGTIANGTLAAGEYIKLNVVRDTDQEITDNGGSTNNTMGLVMVRIDYTAVM